MSALEPEIEEYVCVCVCVCVRSAHRLDISVYDLVIVQVFQASCGLSNLESNHLISNED
jgi:hypothetical protein